MPYTNDKPSDAIKGLPSHAQHIWIAAFNSAWKQHPDDEARCHQIAWAAVKRSGYRKDKSGRWHASTEKGATVRVRVRKDWPIQIRKADQEKRLVYGVVMEPGTTDTQGDTLSAETIEAACHDFMRKYRQQQTALGEGHVRKSRPAVVVESYLAPADFQLGEGSVKAGSWVMVTKVDNEELWAEIKSGEYTGYSIGGSGVRV